jgi:hypothetical protein
LFVRNVNHLNLDAAGICRDWSEPGMAIWQGRHGSPHALFDTGVLVAEDAQHEI